MTNIEALVWQMWRHVDKEPLKRNIFFLLDDIAHAANTHWKELRGMIYQGETRAPLYLEFMEALAVAIAQEPVEGLHVVSKPIKAGEPLMGLALMCGDPKEKYDTCIIRGNIEFLPYPEYKRIGYINID